MGVNKVSREMTTIAEQCRVAACTKIQRRSTRCTAGKVGVILANTKAF